MIHYFKRVKPDVYKEINDAASRRITGKQFAECKAKYLERGYMEEYVLEELICDVGAQVLLKANGLKGGFFSQSEWENLFGSKENAAAVERGIVDALKVNLGGNTDTSEFKKWFGDSKVVDERGKPLVVYHGTASDFSIFNKTKALDKEGRKTGIGWGKGKFYFTSSHLGAEGAASGAEYFGRGKQQNIMPVYLSIKKPVSADEYLRMVEKETQKGISRDAAIPVWISNSKTSIMMESLI